MGVSDIKAGGAYVELGAKDVTLRQNLERGEKRMREFATAATTYANKASDALSSVGSKMAGAASSLSTGLGQLRAGFGLAASGAKIFFAPVMILTDGIISLTSTVIDLAQSLLSVAWTQFKRGALAAAAAIGLSLKTYADFEQQLANISTVIGPTNAGYWVDEFRDGLRRLSVEVGESTTTLAKGLYDIISAAIPAGDAMHVLEVAAKAARAGLTDTGKAADVLTTILNAYGMATSQATRVSDILFQTVLRGKITFAELAQSFGRVASIAASANVSLEEVGAVISVMTRSGVKADEAITSLTAILSTFLSPTDEAVEIARKLGFEMSTTAIKTEGFAKILKKIAKQSPEMLAKLFPNIRALRGILPALRNMTGFTDDLKAMANSAGSTEQAFATMIDTIAFGFARLRQSVVVLLGEIGELFGPTFEEAMTILTNWVGTAREWLKAHSADVQLYIGDAWKAIQLVASTVWEWLKTNVLDQMGGSFNDVWNTITASAITFWQTLRTIWRVGSALLTGIFDIVKLFFDDPVAAGAKVADAFNKVWASAASTADLITGGGTLLDKLVAFMNGLIDRLAQTGFSEKFADLLRVVFDTNTRLWSAIIDWAASIGNVLGERVYDALIDALDRALKWMFLHFPPIWALNELFGNDSDPWNAPATPSGSDAGSSLFGPGGTFDRVGAGESAGAAAGATQNVIINARNPLSPDVIEGIVIATQRLKNRGR